VRYTVHADGFATQPLHLEIAGVFSSAHLVQNGVRVPKGPERGTFVLRRDDGREAVARLRPSAFLFLDPVPTVEIDGERIQVVQPFRWYELVWLALPILLIFGGGAIGGAVGVGAAAMNATVFRSQGPGPRRYVLTAGISLLAIIVYIVLASLALGLMGR
jgi:hypothetical protein